MTDDTARLAQYIDVWRDACAAFVDLCRSLDEDDAHRPTDLAGWDVHACVAHTAHLEAVLAGAPEETVEVPELPHVKGLMGRYTEQGVLARRDRSMSELCDEIERSVAARADRLRADPPTDPRGKPERTFGGIPWDNETLLGNRPLDVWMHEQDIRRALDRPGGYDAPAAQHTIDRLAAALPMVLGKRVAPPDGTSLRVDLPELERSWSLAIRGSRAAFIDEPVTPAAAVELTAEDFVVLAGGRRPAERTTPRIEGDRALATRFLEAMAVTP